MHQNMAKDIVTSIPITSKLPQLLVEEVLAVRSSTLMAMLWPFKLVADLMVPQLIIFYLSIDHYELCNAFNEVTS